MIPLARCRGSLVWFALLVGLTAFVVTTAAATPHDDGDAPSCLVCKVRQTAFQHESPVLSPDTGAARTTAVTEPNDVKASLDVVDFNSPRAPPA